MEIPNIFFFFRISPIEPSWTAKKKNYFLMHRVFHLNRTHISNHFANFGRLCNLLQTPTLLVAISRSKDIGPKSDDNVVHVVHYKTHCVYIIKVHTMGFGEEKGLLSRRGKKILLSGPNINIIQIIKKQVKYTGTENHVFFLTIIHLSFI